MPKTNKDSATAESGNEHTTEADASTKKAHIDSNGTHPDAQDDYKELIQQAKSWIDENQTLAMLGGFGLGVFIGVLLRR